MSANDIIFIDRKTFEVFYQGCADNEGFGKKIGQGKTLDEAIDIANDYTKDWPFSPEYGISFINSKKE